MIFRTASWNFAHKDYVVRIQGNLILAKLKKTDPLGKIMLSKLISLSITNHESGIQFVTNTKVGQHKRQIRQWCSIHLLLHHLDEEMSAVIVLDLLKILNFSHSHVIRNYVEWALMRVYIMFPMNLSTLWK